MIQIYVDSFTIVETMRSFRGKVVLGVSIALISWEKTMRYIWTPTNKNQEMKGELEK